MKTNKLIKILSAVLLSAFLVCGVTASAKTDYPPITDAFFVNDYSSVLSDSVRQEVYNQGKILFERTKAQAVVLIVPSLNGESIEKYSMNVATGWQLGDKDLDNGLLLLISTGDHEIRIEVGRGLEGALPDGRVGLLMEEYAYPPLQNNDYSTAVSDLYNAIVNEIYIEYGIEPDSDYTPASELEKSNVFMYLLPLIMVIILLISRRGRGRFMFIPGFFHVRGRRSSFDDDDFGGFGGFGGGGFSGGGGGFGGGGASGKF